MRPARLLAILCSVAFVSLAAPAAALTCHTVFDRNDNIVYRDLSPPVDMSDRGATQRAALRQRGEFLMTVEADQCPRVVPPGGTTSTGGGTTVEEIVAGLRPYNTGVGAGIMSTGRTSAAPSAPAGAPSPAPARSSAPARSGY